MSDLEKHGATQAAPAEKPKHVEPITAHGHPSPAPAVPAPAKTDEPKAKDTRSDEQLKRDIRAQRDELARTLDALEYKLDVPARGQEFLAVGKTKALNVWDENPVLVAGIAAAGVIATVGGIVASILMKRDR